MRGRKGYYLSMKTEYIKKVLADRSFVQFLALKGIDIQLLNKNYSKPLNECDESRSTADYPIISSLYNQYIQN